MNNIIRFWNQNRKMIIIGIMAIVLLIVIIQLLNQMAIQQNKPNNTIQNEEKEEKLPTKSIVGDSTIGKEVSKSNVELIEAFTKECNDGNIAKAYEMLTDDCKQVLFPKEENFKNGYVNLVFSNKRICNIENFRSSQKLYTYRVTFYEDILATGNAQNAQSYQDYITIDENAEGGKLNINSFIKRKEIGKEEEKEGIKITVISQIVYKDHEDYEIKIENNTNKRIAIDSREKSRTVYLVGDKNVSYSSNIHEIANNLYEIPAYFKRTYYLKFNKIYDTSNSKSVNFSDMIPDYERYEQTPEETKERIKISVNL